jgi:squalene-associated FAD-dependent desaturase
VTVHIVGAGLAGLSAAVELAGAGHAVRLYEAGPAAGGRCRSYFDRTLDTRIDNGNHLLLSGNVAAMAFLERIGARDTLTGPETAIFPFMDLATGERWTVAPSSGKVPWWVLDRHRRVPGSKLMDYFSLIRLRLGGQGATVAQSLGGTGLYQRLLEPLAISALNTPPESALSKLMWAVVEGSLLKGGEACRPLVPREGLSESFIDPALAWLAARGGSLRTGCRIAELDRTGDVVTGLRGPDGAVAVAPGDQVVLAVPAWVAGDMLPDLPVPTEFESIVNIHYRVTAARGEAGFVGLVGGMAEWIFVRPEVVSITISAANRLQEQSSESLALTVWGEVCRVLGLSGEMPQMRVIREKRATFAATAHNEARRPGPRPRHFGCPDNLALAGDWTATGLPATIEGAIRSGCTAAKALLVAPNPAASSLVA